MATNPMITRCAGLNIDTVKKCLRELEYYHFIKRHNLPNGRRNKRIRMITLLRWDTGKELLLKENKIKLDTDNKVLFVRPYP